MHASHVGVVGHIVHAVARSTAAIRLFLLHVWHHGAGVARLNIQQEAGYTQDSQRLADSFSIKPKHGKEDSDLGRILSTNSKYSKECSNTMFEFCKNCRNTAYFVANT